MSSQTRVELTPRETLFLWDLLSAPYIRDPRVDTIKAKLSRSSSYDLVDERSLIEDQED